LCLDKTTLLTQLTCKFSMASAYKATTAK
jgi:hypothetical protein